MIDSNINKLISMAERQSDQRLAQELNPQTETGLLGPAFISASELAYRQKIRDEAQARPMQSPPIVQQLAQQATMSPVQPMPTAPMPMQQQQMPQGYAMGGLIKMANGGMPDPYKYDEKEIENRARDKARTFGGNLFSNIAFGAGDADALKAYAEKGKTSDRLTKALERANLPPDATQEMVSAYRSGTPATVFQSAIDNVPTVYSPLEQRKQLDQGNPVFVGNIDYGGDQFANRDRNVSIKTDSIVKPADAKTVQQAAQKKQSDGVLTSDFKLDVSSMFNKPTGMNPDVAKQSIDTGYMNMNPDYQPSSSIKKPPTTGISNAAKKDAAYAASSDYETLIQQAINAMTDEKGKMQNKWLRIAAGAFNAAQKGSPTLLGGLADLGAGVTEELLALNKEEQDQAQELFALYAAREKLRLDRYTTQYDYDKDRKTRIADAIKNYNADLARYLNTDITKDMTKREAEAITAITYADQGVKPAQGNYGRFVKEIQGIINDINASDPDLTNEEFKEIFDERIKSDKALSIVYDNYTDRGTLGVEDWLNETLSF